MKQPHFRLRLFKVFFLLLFIASCNKADYPFRSLEIRNDEAITKKFFATNGSVTPEAIRVINKLQRYPEQVVALIKTRGFALWDKAIVLNTIKSSVLNTNGLSRGNNINTESPSSICIPLVKDSSQQVIDMLLCYISSKDSVSIITVSAGNYKWYNENKESAGIDGAQISLIMMKLDERVFGHTDFIIKDKSLFSSYTKDIIGQIQFKQHPPINNLSYQQNSSTSGEEDPLLPIEYCFIYRIECPISNRLTTPITHAYTAPPPPCFAEKCLTINPKPPLIKEGGEETPPDGTNPTGPPHTGGGTGGSGGGQPCTPVPLPRPPGSVISNPCPIPVPWEPAALNTLTQELGLNPIQITWLAQNTDYLGLINNQLIEEGFSEEAKTTAKIIIDEGVGNLIDAKWDTDFDNVMDPHLRLLHQCCGSLLWIPSPSGKWASQVTANYAMARQDHPEWSKLRCLWDATQETVHTALDVAGMAPGLGEVFDVVNGIMYTIQGDGLNATLSFASAVPFIGWASTTAKWAKKTIVLTDGTKRTLKWIKLASGKISFGDRQLLRKVLSLPVGDVREAHHIIPWELGETSDLVQEAAKGVDAFNLNELLNGIPLEPIQHNGSHMLYSDRVRIHLNNLEANLKTIGKFNPADARKAIEDLINNIIKPAIVNNPTVPINQIVF